MEHTYNILFLYRPTNRLIQKLLIWTIIRTEITQGSLVCEGCKYISEYAFNMLGVKMYIKITLAI